MEEEKPLEQELKIFQNEFKRNQSMPIVKLGDHYDQLFNTLLRSAHSTTRNNIILQGLPGFGRKSAVSYAIKRISLEKQISITPIWIDAGVFQTENEFAIELVRQFNKNQEETGSNLQKQDIFENVFTFNNLETLLNKKCYGSWTLVVDRIENLATKKRQSVLYALFDWLLHNKNRLSLIGITSDLKFTEKLEKRVKSRFSADQIDFDDYSLEGCIELIKQRIQHIGEQEKCLKLSQLLIEGFSSEEIKEFFEKKIKLMMKPITFIIQLIQTMLCLINIKELQKSIYPGQVIVKVLQQALELHQPMNSLKYFESLADPEKQILICIKRMISHGKYPITFNTISQELIALRKRNTSGSSSNFSFKVLQKAVENLINFRMIRLLNSNEGEINGQFNSTNNIILSINYNELCTYLTENAETLESSLKLLSEVY